MNKRIKKYLTKNYQIQDEIILNNLAFTDYLLRLERLARSIFEWKLPSSMNSEFLEKTLYFNGESTLLKDETFGFINTKCSHSGGLNIYDLPTQLHCYSHDYSKERSLFVGLIPENNEFNECILVRNNWDSLPTFDSIYLFALRLAECDRTSDINMNRTKNSVGYFS